MHRRLRIFDFLIDLQLIIKKKRFEKHVSGISKPKNKLQSLHLTKKE